MPASPDQISSIPFIIDIPTVLSTKVIANTRDMLRDTAQAAVEQRVLFTGPVLEIRDSQSYSGSIESVDARVEAIMSPQTTVHVQTVLERILIDDNEQIATHLKTLDGRILNGLRIQRWLGTITGLLTGASGFWAIQELAEHRSADLSGSLALIGLGALMLHTPNKRRTYRDQRVVEEVVASASRVGLSTLVLTSLSKPKPDEKQSEA